MSSSVSDVSLEGALDTDSDTASISTSSSTSTVRYSHEPFQDFQHRVMSLALEKFWVDAASDEITIERHPGGGYNRIIGITWRDRNNPDVKIQYILRVPRFDAAQVDNNVAALLFIQRHSKIPAPRIISFDDSQENQLHSPYMVINRLVGSSLDVSFSKLSHRDRCQLASEIGIIIRQMLSITSNKAGKLVLPPDNKSMEAPLHILPWISTDTLVSVPYNDAPTTETVYEMLTASFEAQMAEELRIRPKSRFKPDYILKFIGMTSGLQEAGWLNDCPYSLAHLDLAPRNIMIHLTSNIEKPLISGILDWDSAILAPRFMACAPPTWLWAWGGDDTDKDDYGEATNYDPSTAKGQELKQRFEDATGEEFKRFAYEPVYRLARRLIRFNIEGLQSNEHFKEAEAMLQEWNTIRQTEKPG